MEHGVCVSKKAHIIKSLTLTRVLYFSNIYSQAQYLYSAPMSVIYHVLHILLLTMTGILPLNVFLSEPNNNSDVFV